jgi:hypothetical protein
VDSFPAVMLQQPIARWGYGEELAGGGHGVNCASGGSWCVSMWTLYAEGGGRSTMAAMGLFMLHGAAAGVRELVHGWLGNVLVQGESRLGLVGEAEKLGPAMNLLLLVGETRGPLGDARRSMLLCRE